MRLLDNNRMAFTAIVRYPLRSSMLLLAIAIGVSAVLMLTSLAEGARLYVTDQFNSMGTHLLMVSPGKNEVGGVGSIATSMSGAPRPLTLEDAMAVERNPLIATVTPLLPGSGTVNYQGVERTIDVVGATYHMQQLFNYEMQSGRFLPRIDLDNISAQAVLGNIVARELFGTAAPVGKWVRLGDRRVRVIGVMAQAGQTGAINVDEAVFVPIAFAMQMYNRDSIHRMMVEAVSEDALARAEQAIIATIKERHAGHDDVTVLNQGAILATFNTIFLVLTTSLAGVASISLLVAGTLIMNVMLVAVSQRTEEIGLIKALGGKRRQIITLFLTEAAILSLLGAFVGVLAGQLVITIARQVYPIVNFQAPGWAVIAAVLMALVSGLLFGIMPARRAAALNPVEALAGR